MSNDVEWTKGDLNSFTGQRGSDKAVVEPCVSHAKRIAQ